MNYWPPKYPKATRTEIWNKLNEFDLSQYKIFCNGELYLEYCKEKGLNIVSERNDCTLLLGEWPRYEQRDLSTYANENSKEIISYTGYECWFRTLKDRKDLEKIKKKPLKLEKKYPILRLLDIAEPTSGGGRNTTINAFFVKELDGKLILVTPFLKKTCGKWNLTTLMKMT